MNFFGDLSEDTGGGFSECFQILRIAQDDMRRKAGWHERESRMTRKENEGKRGTSARKFINIDLIIKQFEVPEEDFPFSI